MNALLQNFRNPIFLIFFLMLFFPFVGFGQQQIYILDFETSGGYGTSTPEFTDGSADYFIRTDGSDINASFSNIQGSYFFGAQDIDGEGAAPNQTFSIDNINISGYSNLELRVYLAEDDDGSNQDWDDNDFVHFGYDMDNTGTYTDILNIESFLSGTNGKPGVDTDFDGIADGTEITDSFTQITVSIPSTGNSLDLQIEFDLNSGDEDIAIDMIEIYGIPPTGNIPPDISNIQQTPSAVNVTSSDAVSVSADVTDSDGVASVSLNWGLTSGNLANTIVMTLGTGSTYTTSSNIPAQANGTTVYYEITASDAAATPTTNTSPEQSYTAQDPVPAPSLIISEVADPEDDFNGRFVEIYNNGTLAIDFDNVTVFLARYSNTNTTAQSVELNGTLAPGDFYVVVLDSLNFPTYYGTTADLESGIVDGNGNDTYTLYVGGNWNTGGTLFDIYGEIGTDGTGQPWEYLDSRAVRNNLSTSPNTTWTASEWTITTANLVDMTPGEAESSIAYTYNGSWTPANPNGVATVSDNISVVSGTAVFTQDISVNDINISAGAALEVEQVLFVDGNITNDGSIVFINNATKLGQFGEFSGTISGTGNVTVQRYIPARRAFRFISSAVTTTSSIHANWQEGATSSTNNPASGFGTHITGSTIDQQNGFDGTATGNPSMFVYDNTVNPQTQQPWGNVPNTDVLTLDAGKAYRLFIRGDRSISLTTNTPTPTNTVLRATGSLIVGNHTNGVLSQIAGGYSFIGNPYQAIVNMNDVLENSTNLNTNYYYLWDPNQSTRGAYVLVNLPDGTAVPPSGGGTTSSANEFLQPGQAVFVSTLANGAASILFEESDKAVAQTPTDVFKPSTTKASIAVTLFESNAFSNGGTSSDGFLVEFSQNGNNDIDFRDAAKPFNIDENVGLVNSVGYFIMENRNMPTEADVLQFYNNNYRHTDYIYQIEVNGLNNMTAYMVDAYLGTQSQLISGMNQINFSVDQSISGTTDSNRFSIIFKSLSIEEEAFSGFSIYPNPVKEGSFFISIPGMNGKDAKVSLYDVLGRKVMEEKMNIGSDSRVQIKTNGLQSGVYVVQVDAGSASFNQKLIVER